MTSDFFSKYEKEKQYKIKQLKGMEKVFYDCLQEHKNEIQEKLKEADKALKEAEEIAEKYGIPFQSRICNVHFSWSSNHYKPKSFAQKWPELESEKTNEMLQSVGEYGRVPQGEYDFGWEHSGACE